MRTCCAGSMWCLVAAIVTSVSPLGYDNKLFWVHREESLHKTSANVCMYVHVTDSHVLEWSCRSRLLEHFYILWDCGYCCYVLHAQCYLT